MKVKDTNETQLTTLLIDELVRAYKIAGYKIPDSESLRDTVQLLSETLRTDNANLDTDTLQAAIRQGSLGKLGEYAGISVKTVSGWIVAYKMLANDQRVNRVEYTEEPMAEKTTEEKAYWRRMLVESCYANFLNGQFNAVGGNYLLNALVTDGIIDNVEQRLARATAHVKEILKAEAPTHRGFWQSFEAYIDGNTDGEAAKLAVNQFFSELKQKGITQIYT